MAAPKLPIPSMIPVTVATAFSLLFNSFNFPYINIINNKNY